MVDELALEWAQRTADPFGEGTGEVGVGGKRARGAGKDAVGFHRFLAILAFLVFIAQSYGGWEEGERRFR